MSYVWETDNLVKEFTLSGGLFKPKQTVHAVQGVSLYQSPGETLGIVGESGCGKSTFGYTLMGLYQATSGSIYMNGRHINPYVDRESCSPGDAMGISKSLCIPLIRGYGLMRF